MQDIHRRQPFVVEASDQRIDGSRPQELPDNATGRCCIDRVHDRLRISTRINKPGIVRSADCEKHV
jgi:hypothetical protein